MNRRLSRFPARRLLLPLILLLSFGTMTASAQAVNRLWITTVNANNFPDVTVSFIAQGAEGKPLSDLAALQILENGEPRDITGTSLNEPGIAAYLIIDANETINDDDGTDSSRRDDVVAAVNLFADDYMDPNQVDRVTIIVPPDDENPDGTLTENAIFINEVKNAINVYNPDPSDPAPLNDMLQQALDRAEAAAEEGRAQTIILFTDGAFRDQPVDFGAVVERALAHNVTIFAAILGERDDPDEVANVQRLFEPTFGAYVHMPTADDLTPILETVQQLSQQNLVTFRSRVAASGTHNVALELAGVSGEAPYAILLSPPEVAILIDNSQPIVRVADEVDTDLADMQPTEQLIVAQVTFPDGHPRQITALTLLVDGVEQPLPDDVQPDADGVISFEWDLEDIDQGQYEMALLVTDELGLEGANDPLPLTVEVSRPVAPPDPETDTDGAADPVEEPPATVGATDPAGFISENMGVLGIAGGVVAIAVAFLVLLLAVVLVRRRSRPAVAQPVTPTVAQAKATAGAMDADSTQIISPDFVLQQTAGAYLEVVEHAPEHAGPIFIPGKNAAFGRDERVAQIVFKDRSVSRLHARIMESSGTYSLYDEGSASGTYHNFERVGLTPHTLADNDDIHFGRVHLRFHLNRGGSSLPDDDSTQIFGPSGAPVRPAAAAAGEDTSTQVFNPHDAPPGRGSAPPGPPADEDPDDTSTQPFMPHH